MTLEDFIQGSYQSPKKEQPEKTGESEICETREQLETVLIDAAIRGHESFSFVMTKTLLSQLLSGEHKSRKSQRAIQEDMK